MKTKSVLCGILWIGFSCICVFASTNEANRQSPGPTNLVTLTAFDFQERHYQCVVTMSNFIAGPQWHVENAEPPLLPRTALLIAQEQAFRIAPSSVKFRPKRISLERMWSIWYYVIELEPSNPRSPFGGIMEDIKIPVLMDGKVGQFLESKRDTAKRFGGK